MNSYFFEVGDQIEVRLFLKARKSQTLPFLTSQVVQEPPKHEVQSDQLQLIFLNIGPCQKKKETRTQAHPVQQQLTEILNLLRVDRTQLLFVTHILQPNCQHFTTLISQCSDTTHKSATASRFPEPKHTFQKIPK
jgi:hypothetical protein